MSQSAENKGNKTLKSLKASPELHREIKRESADTGIKIEDLVERAWQCYCDAKTINPDTKTVPIPTSSGINKNSFENSLQLDGNVVMLSKSELVTLLELSSTLTDKLQVITLKRADGKGKINPTERPKDLAEKAAKLFDKAERLRTGADQGSGKAPTGNAPPRSRAAK